MLFACEPQLSIAHVSRVIATGRQKARPDPSLYRPERLASLLLIGALACYALWLIALAVRARGYRIEFGSRKKAAQALSLISLARWWIAEQDKVTLSRRRLDQALTLLRSMALVVQI